MTEETKHDMEEEDIEILLLKSDENQMTWLVTKTLVMLLSYVRQSNLYKWLDQRLAEWKENIKQPQLYFLFFLFFCGDGGHVKLGHSAEA